jgi:hypothetical protein
MCHYVTCAFHSANFYQKQTTINFCVSFSPPIFTKHTVLDNILCVFLSASVCETRSPRFNFVSVCQQIFKKHSVIDKYLWAPPASSVFSNLLKIQKNREKPSLMPLTVHDFHCTDRHGSRQYSMVFCEHLYGISHSLDKIHIT